MVTPSNILLTTTPLLKCKLPFITTIQTNRATTHKPTFTTIKELDKNQNKNNTKLKNNKKVTEKVGNNNTDNKNHLDIKQTQTKLPVVEQTSTKKLLSSTQQEEKMIMRTFECEFYILNQANKAYDNPSSFEYKQAIQTIQNTVS